MKIDAAADLIPPAGGRGARCRDGCEIGTGEAFLNQIGPMLHGEDAPVRTGTPAGSGPGSSPPSAAEDRPAARAIAPAAAATAGREDAAAQQDASAVAPTRDNGDGAESATPQKPGSGQASVFAASSPGYAPLQTQPAAVAGGSAVLAETESHGTVPRPGDNPAAAGCALQRSEAKQAEARTDPEKPATPGTSPKERADPEAMEPAVRAAAQIGRPDRIPSARDASAPVRDAAAYAGSVGRKADSNGADAVARHQNSGNPPATAHAPETAPGRGLFEGMRNTGASPEPQDAAAKPSPGANPRAGWDRDAAVRAQDRIPASEQAAENAAPGLASRPAGGGGILSFDAAAAPASPSRTAEFVLHLADQIRILVREGRGEIRIRLNPDHLGRLEILAETTVNGLAARISAESGAVKRYLESNLQGLQQNLEAQGLKVDRIHIVFQDAADGRSPADYGPHFGHPGSGREGGDTGPSPGPRISVDANSFEEPVLEPDRWLDRNPHGRFHTVA